MTRRGLLASLMVVGVMAGTIGTAGAGVGVISKKNMEWVFNIPAATGSDIEFFERRLEDGTLKRYAIMGVIGHGFQIYDITNPDIPVPAGAYAGPGIYYQGDIQVNPRRNLVTIATDGAPGASVPQGGVGSGFDIVDITDVMRPTALAGVNNVGGAHNTTMVGDNHVYTELPTYVIDITNPAAPVNKGQKSFICGHDLTVDPNNSNIMYSACPGGTNKWQIINVSDPANPVLIKNVPDSGISIGHQADPAPDSSFVVVTDERGGGITNEFAPGGGVHVYDISGKYTQPNATGPASMTNPIKMGVWFAPFYGVSTGNTMSGPWGNVTAHNLTFQAERYLMSIGWYSMGSWVTDMEDRTNDTGPYAEWKGTHSNGGPTTWGNTQGNILLEGDEVWSTKWTRFDDPKFDRYAFNSGLTRGFDVIRFTGALPKKIARLAVNATAPGGAVSGKLDRYAVWTYQGFVNKPLAGQTVSISKPGGPSATATTAADGTFSATLSLATGNHTIVASWTDANGVYRTATTTQTVTR